MPTGEFYESLIENGLTFPPEIARPENETKEDRAEFKNSSKIILLCCLMGLICNWC